MSSCGYYDPSQTPTPPSSGGGSGGDTGGGWDGAEPGNGAYLAAQAIPGGIRVRWDYPSVNPHAVAHVLVYRSASEDFNTAGLRTLIDGSEFVDHIQAEHHQTYHYWVRFVTLSGARLDPLGPVAGVFDPTLTGGGGEADLGPVGLSDLTEDIQNILAQVSPLQEALAQESVTREEGHVLLVQAMTDLDAQVTTALAGMQEQVDLVTGVDTDYAAMMNDLSAQVAKMESDLDAGLALLPDVKIVALAQAQYDSIATPDPNTLYVITS